MANSLLKKIPYQIFLFTVIVGAVGFSLTPTSSQEYSPSPVQNGDYRTLTLWGTVTLGSAYFTNPHKVAAIDVAYSYDGPEFSNELKREALWSLAKQNRISFGIIDEAQNKILVIPLSELKKRYAIDSADELDKVLSSSDIAVVANTSSLLGASSKSTVVKTQPNK